jgi:hypothetical protein
VLSKPRGFDLLPQPMQAVLNMLGESGKIHLETRLFAETYSGEKIHEFHIQAAYNVPPVAIQINGRGRTLEDACADVTWQFLEQIGMGPAE